MSRERRPILWRGDFRHEWYDWAIVWRYWNGQGVGLRTPTYPEARELLRLAAEAGLGSYLLAQRTGLHEKTIQRWLDRFGLRLPESDEKARV